MKGQDRWVEVIFTGTWAEEEGIKEKGKVDWHKK
jgi:hypothetical protein